MYEVRFIIISEETLNHGKHFRDIEFKEEKKIALMIYDKIDWIWNVILEVRSETSIEELQQCYLLKSE